MKLKFGPLTVGLLALSTSTSFGQWSPRTQALLSDYRHHLSDSFVSTIWASVLNTHVHPIGSGLQKKIKIPSTFFTSGELEVGLYLQTDANNRPKLAPLMTYIPGMFGRVDDAPQNFFTKHFADRGFHVLVVPNPWSPEFIAAKPMGILPGNVAAEANIIMDIISRMRANLDSQNLVSDTWLSGSSYGAFVTTVIAALDAENTQKTPGSRPLISGQYSAFGPPLELASALESLDSIMDRNQRYAERLTDVQKYLISQNILAAKRDEDLNKLTIEYAPSLMAFVGFNENLSRTTVDLDRLYSMGKIPPFRRDFLADPAYKRWSFSWRFRDFVKLYTPAHEAIYRTDLGTLQHWMARALGASNDRFRIFAAQDDFLNSPEQWAELKTSYDSRTLLLAEHGGHLGYFPLTWFRELLDSAFLK